MIEIHYYIPENLEELSTLVGKLVGINDSLNGGTIPMVYFGVQRPFKMSEDNYKLFPDSRAYMEKESHEFLRQRIDWGTEVQSLGPLDIIESVCFENDKKIYFNRASIDSNDIHFLSLYSGDSRDTEKFKQRQEFLQSLGYWQTPIEMEAAR